MRPRRLLASGVAALQTPATRVYEMSSKEKVRFEGISTQAFRARVGMRVPEFLELALPKARDVRWRA